MKRIMVECWDEVYSAQLHDSAASWGLDVLPGRPLINDRVDPYPNPTPVETLEWRMGWRHVEITLLTLNGQWSFCLSVTQWGEGTHFGPWRKFCAPHSTRVAALNAAIEAVRRLRPGSDLAAWLDGLMQPVQMGLF